jgi:hypothetical protein
MQAGIKTSTGARIASAQSAVRFRRELVFYRWKGHVRLAEALGVWDGMRNYLITAA